jgi:hypothetical protein
MNTLQKSLAGIWVGILAIAASAEVGGVEPFSPSALSVVESQEIDLGTRSLIFNRVEPPILAERPAQPPLQEPNYTPEQLERMQRQANKALRFFMVSATVYDRTISELRCHSRGQDQIRVYANIDFNLMAGVTEIETEEAVYMIMIGLGNEPRESIDQWNAYVDENNMSPTLKKRIPNLSEFPVGGSTYMMISETHGALATDSEHSAPVQSSSPSEPQVESEFDLHAALDALLSYYDANAPRLAADHAALDSANTARKKWLEENPPAPKDTVINFWPQQNSIYLGGGE